MFDIGFSEILMIAVVALVVIGPERLPGVARNVGRFAGRLQRYVHDIKKDFNREVELEEIRRLQHEMETTVQSMQESMRAVESTLQKEVQTTRASVEQIVDAANPQPAVVASVAAARQSTAAPGAVAAPSVPPTTTDGPPVDNTQSAHPQSQLTLF